ncbi:thiamine phosphate synthase [Alteromonas sp. ZYF713]|nr:thiamine phosphate synthase [Alteromonas sp. ZYF713]
MTVTEQRPIIWCIGGSDSGGGAGIQADILTLHDLGCHACTVITAVTAQNSVAVEQVAAVAPELLSSQGHALLNDMPPQAIKIGLLCNDEQVDVVIELINLVRERDDQVRVIWDPVQVATSGAKMASVSARGCRALLACVDLCTPNSDEEQYLLACVDGEVNSEHLLKTRLLCTGGHSSAEQAEDRLYTTQTHWCYSSIRQQATHQHGSGCTFASAIAAAMALDYPLHDAVCVAKAYVNMALTNGYAAGSGAGPLARCGWPTDEHYFPNVRQLPADADLTVPPEGFAPLACHQLGLYPVVDSLEWLALLLPLGLNIIQLRIKQPGADLAEQIRQAVNMAAPYQTRLFINDHWQLAIECGAYGVHLGQEDLEAADLSAIYNAGLRLGISTHGYAELCRAKRFRPSYIALGHIFATQTKVMPSKPQGLARLRRYQQLSGDIPTVAIGGISQARFADVADTGVNGVAVVSAITGAADPLVAVNRLKETYARVKQR